MKKLKVLCAGVAISGALCMAGVAAELTGSASVNVTSDTSVNAKTMAFNEARRQIIVDVLSPYADVAALRAAVAAEKSSALTPLIASSGISGEKLSDTTYAARITMTVNRRAARDWMASHDVQNWLAADDVSSDTFPMVLVMGNRVSDWTDVRRAAANAGIDLNTVSIADNQVLFDVASSRRGALTIALRSAGWHYKDKDGVLYISR